MPGQEHINQLFNNNSKAFGDATEQQYKAGTYKRGDVFLSQVKKQVPDVNAYVFDYGCGTGRISMMLGEAGYRVLAVDPAQDHIDIANRLNNFEQVKFKLLGAELDSPNAVFDAVVSSSVLEFVPDVEVYLQEITRCLKPGGIFLVSIPNLYSLWRLYSKIRFGKRYKHFDFQKNLFTPRQLDTKMKGLGFASIASPIYFESAFDQKGLSFLNKSPLFGTLVLLTFVKK